MIDSNIIIDHLCGIKEATIFMMKNFGECCISPITYAEVLAGCIDEHIIHVKSYLEAFHFITLDTKDASIAAEIRKLHKIKLPDAFQAALSQNRNLFLVTRNTKDFSSKKFPFVLVPYQVVSEKA